MSKKEIIWLIIIFAIACGLRLLFIFTTPHLSNTESYYHLRIAEELKSTVIPKFYDRLSYSGKTDLYSPVFYYTIQPLLWMSNPETAAKIFPSILISTLVFPVFLISRKITNKTNFSLLTAFVSIFIPANITLTFNKFDPNCIMIPLMFLTLYFAMEIKRYTTYFIIASIAGAATHPTFLLLITAFILYLTLIKAAGLKADNKRVEAILFSAILTFWAVLVIYKSALLLNGIAIIWQNIPQQILRKYFFGINILEAVYTIGLVPLLAGIFVIYKYINSKIKREIYMLISFGMSIIVLTAAYLLKPDYGLTIIGIVLTILFGVFLSDLWDYLANARSKIIRPAIVAAILISIIFTNIAPSIIYIQRSIDESDISETYKALEWIKENTDNNSVILSSPEEGNLVSYFAERKNVIDENYLNQPDAEERLEDVNRIYKTGYSTEAIPLLTKYKTTYILFTPYTAEKYNTQSLRFINENCFELVYDKETKVYKSLCEMKT